MSDPRLQQYAELLVGRCVDVQPRWQVSVRTTPLARPLLDAILVEIAHREAWPIVQWAVYDNPWAYEAPLELLEEPAPIQRTIMESADAFITVIAPENTRELADLDPERRERMQKGFAPLRARTMSMSVPWVICEYPVAAAAQEAGMTLREYEEFLYGAVLLDWDEEGKKMRRIADRFDSASTVRIVGDGTDLTLSVEGRSGAVDDGRVNMPGGEVFYSPVEDSAEGEITFSEFPAVYFGNEVEGVRLRFSHGEIVDAAASKGEDFLVQTLNTDGGARRLGELGIGCNPGIQRFMKNVGFDEKIDGTIHLAVGNSYTFTGGTNESVVHWDMVKDLRTSGQIWCDGELVQENGAWQL